MSVHIMMRNVSNGVDSWEIVHRVFADHAAAEICAMTLNAESANEYTSYSVDTHDVLTDGIGTCIETLTDSSRQLLVVLVTEAWVRIRDDLAASVTECETLMRQLSGTDIRVVVHRAYPSRNRT